MVDSIDIQSIVRGSLDTETFKSQHWQGSFADYLKIVEANPLVLRSAHQRVYDMVLSYGVEEIERDRVKITRYKFFDDPIGDGEDGLYGLERPMMNLMNVLKAAAHGYGPEHRVLLLHGPVGSSKSTIVRLLKKGLEAYSKTDAGSLYTFSWRIDGELEPSPMHEEPLLLIPESAREKVLEALNKNTRSTFKMRLETSLSPVAGSLPGPSLSPLLPATTMRMPSYAPLLNAPPMSALPPPTCRLQTMSPVSRSSTQNMPDFCPAPRSF